MKLPKLDKEILAFVLKSSNPTTKELQELFYISKAEAQRYIDLYESRKDLIDLTQKTESAVGEFKKPYLSEGYKFVEIDEKTVNSLMGALAVEGSFKVMSEIGNAINNKDFEMVKALVPLQLGMMSFMKPKDK